jgi:exopolyphosphatase/guanosine-5'-triphosphate,3'-diphosphate pyrophosphatase
MKVAAIDVGSNSIHMIVVDALPGRGLRVIDREKDMVRLGDSAFDAGHLSASAQAKAIATLRRFLVLARRHGANAILAAATSAVREADNGAEFLRLVRRATGQHVSLLGEREEARLIYLAVRDAMDLRGGRSLVLDVGGGSVEWIVGNATAMAYGTSLPLGVLRLAARFGTGALGRRARRRLQDEIRGAIAPGVAAARRHRARRVVGTAGTVNSLARLLAAERGETLDAETPSGLWIASGEIERLADRLLSLPLRARRRLPGLDPKRADSVGYGAAVLAEALRAVSAEGLVTCRAAVREGMVLEYLATHRLAPARRGAKDVRERSVRDTADRYGAPVEHAEHAARLATALFDGTRRLHGLGPDARELLGFACLLHDVGQHVEHRRHHRHSYYLVRNAELSGFAPEEIEILALVARYHRKAPPKDEHEEWRAASGPVKRVARPLAAFLRVADGLDRGHAREVRSVACRVRKDEVVVRLHGRGDLTPDLWAAREKADLLEEVCGRPVRFVGNGVARARRRRGKARARRGRR